MKRFSPYLVMLLLALPAFRAVAQERGIEVVARENLGSRTATGTQYALFIAADARGIREILTRDYFIDETIELYNAAATKEWIIETFVSLQQKLGIHDSLFIYYAGHGHLDQASGQGFWIPVNGGVNKLSQENWLPNSQICGYIANLKTIHVFIASDACFSGDILDTNRALPPEINNNYFRNAYALTSRQALTSGASETVPDQSEFAAAFRICLEKNTQSLIDPISIYNDIRLSVRSIRPAAARETLTALRLRHNMEDNSIKRRVV